MIRTEDGKRVWDVGAAYADSEALSEMFTPTSVDGLRYAQEFLSTLEAFLQSEEGKNLLLFSTSTQYNPVLQSIGRIHFVTDLYPMLKRLRKPATP